MSWPITLSLEVKPPIWDEFCSQYNQVDLHFSPPPPPPHLFVCVWGGGGGSGKAILPLAWLSARMYQNFSFRWVRLAPARTGGFVLRCTYSLTCQQRQLSLDPSAQRAGSFVSWALVCARHARCLTKRLVSSCVLNSHLD